MGNGSECVKFAAMYKSNRALKKKIEDDGKLIPLFLVQNRSDSSTL